MATDDYKIPTDLCEAPEPYHLHELGEQDSAMRTFDTGATRDQEADKFDYEGFLSPLALTRFAAYMHEHRVQSDGTLRASDNWQKGIPLSSYMKSLWRHLLTVWHHHRGWLTQKDDESLEEALCAVIFNAQGYLHEIMKEKQSQSVSDFSFPCD